MNPVKLEIFLDDKTLAGMRSVEGNFAMMENVTKEVINHLKLQLQDLEKQYKVLQQQGLASDKDMADIQALQGAIGQLKDRLKEYEAAKKKANETPILENDPAPKLNSVKMSMQQIARELPSLAMGPQMFFLAISNNIPMFTDAVGNARKEYERLTAAGQKATPIWKQLLMSLFSWQTAMAAAITLTVVYGKEIGEWIKGLFKAKDATLDLLSAEQEMALARSKASDGIKKERAELDILYTKLKDTSLSTKERTASINEWMKRYPEYANILSGENISLSKLQSAYSTLSKEIYANAVARNYADKVADLSVKKEKEEIKRLNQKATLMKAQRAYDSALEVFNNSTGQSKNAAAINVGRAEEELQKQQKIYDGIVQSLKVYDDNITTISNHIKTNDLFPQPKEGAYDYWTQQKERAEGVLKEIKSDIKKTLDDASKEGKDLFSLGIDKSVVETYKQATSDLKKAKKELKIYDTKDPKTTGKTVTDYQNELADARVRAQQKIEAARIAIMQEGYEKRTTLADKEYKDNLAAIDKEERDTLNKLEKSKKAGNKVTPEEVQQVKADANLQRALARQEYIKQYAGIQTDWMQESVQSWIDYNKKYGTYQEKRLAITQEYAMKIAKAENYYDKEALRKQMDEALSSLDFDKLKKSMNWEAIFGNLSSLTRKQLQDVKRQLVSFKNSPEFKQKSSPEQIKIIEDALNNINTTLADKSGVFGSLGESLDDYKDKLEKAKKAQEEYDKALKTGNEALIEKTEKQRNDANGNLIQSGNNLERSKNKTISNITSITNALTQLGSAEFSLSSFGSVVGGLVDALSSSGSKIGGIIAAILSLLDEFGKDGGVEFGKNVVNNLINAIGGTVEVPFKMLGIDMGLGGADYSDYNKMVDQYTHLNEIWDELLDKKTEYIKMSYGEETVKAGEEAEVLVNKTIENYRILGRERLNSGASAGSHAIGKRMAKGTSASDWKDIAGAIGMSVNDAKDFIGTGRMTGLFDLTTEQLEKLRDEAPGFWAKMDDDVRNYLNNIIEGEARIEEIQKQVKEQLTQVSFDSVRSSFLDTLMDMDSSSEDFADNFAKYMQRAILNGKLTELYDQRLQDWYDNFANANKDGNVDTSEYDKLKEEWNQIVTDALADRDALKNIFGWEGDEGSTQTGRSGAYAALSQEQGTKLEGLFTSVQDHVSGIHQLLKELKEGRAEDQKIFMQIAENTAYCRLLQDMLEIMERQDRDGTKLRN